MALVFYVGEENISGAKFFQNIDVNNNLCLIRKIYLWAKYFLKQSTA